MISDDQNCFNLILDSMRIEIVQNMCQSQTEISQIFEIEKLHMLLCSIGDITKCSF